LQPGRGAKFALVWAVMGWAGLCMPQTGGLLSKGRAQRHPVEALDQKALALQPRRGSKFGREWVGCEPQHSRAPAVRLVLALVLFGSGLGVGHPLEASVVVRPLPVETVLVSFGLLLIALRP
jgi:hypothetical protein